MREQQHSQEHAQSRSSCQHICSPAMRSAQGLEQDRSRVLKSHTHRERWRCEMLQNCSDERGVHPLLLLLLVVLLLLLLLLLMMMMMMAMMAMMAMMMAMMTVKTNRTINGEIKNRKLHPESASPSCSPTKIQNIYTRHAHTYVHRYKQARKKTCT